MDVYLKMPTFFTVATYPICTLFHSGALLGNILQ
jgi:hypothetical protein